MIRTLKAMTDFAAVTVTAPFSLLTLAYEAHKLDIKEQIIEMAFKGSGVRDTANTLKIGINTVIRTLKNSRQSE
ncbi:hypothetical protein KB20921_26450 [Edwardsiella ictaluri]|uniref:Iso-IS1 ORF1 n=1 Tax=Edwardsiella ictaluri (strain 93-146) TaxID=634503 RepID=C5B8T3_EDWI9|nr:iso-IS1 ORF1 [Edwardsiella ictaluri 93-146]STP83413.1 Transposase and inactivated derivatives [Edwardsiella ictaluri]BEH99900.1 hypothetical protein KH20906_26280 [Edwardsiella ictaluri]BEI03384.1 hypothetical protein KB20921_26450 [Edwardsiella ictaluri]BEI06845.1 hypothetical protein KH201010_26310 [Edwardsiella ictaluri]